MISSTYSTGSSMRNARRCPGWPPRLRPEGTARRFAGTWGGSDDGGREELEKCWPSLTSSSRTRACGRHFRRAARRFPGGASPTAAAATLAQEPTGLPKARAPEAEASRSCCGCSGRPGKLAAGLSNRGAERLQYHTYAPYACAHRDAGRAIIAAGGSCGAQDSVRRKRYDKVGYLGCVSQLFALLATLRRRNLLVILDERGRRLLNHILPSATFDSA
jgi:hypothetical protein